MINGGSVLVTHYGKDREQNDKDKHLKPTITQLANPFQHPHPQNKNKKNKQIMVMLFTQLSIIFQAFYLNHIHLPF